MRPVFVIGFMTTGKTKHGRQLAKTLKRSFFDLDAEIEKHNNHDIEQMFKYEGENYFREKEREMLHLTVKHEDAVIACGGGTPCYFDNMDWMLNNGTVLWLKAGLQTILNRLMQSKKKRPLIQNIPESELADKILCMMNHRVHYYSKAHIGFNTENISIKALADAVRSWEAKHKATDKFLGNQN